MRPIRMWFAVSTALALLGCETQTTDEGGKAPTISALGEAACTTVAPPPAGSPNRNIGTFEYSADFAAACGASADFWSVDWNYNPSGCGRQYLFQFEKTETTFGRSDRLEIQPIYSWYSYTSATCGNAHYTLTVWKRSLFPTVQWQFPFAAQLTATGHWENGRCVFHEDNLSTASPKVALFVGPYEDFRVAAQYREGSSYHSVGIRFGASCCGSEGETCCDRNVSSNTDAECAPSYACSGGVCQPCGSAVGQVCCWDTVSGSQIAGRNYCDSPLGCDGRRCVANCGTTNAPGCYNPSSNMTTCLSTGLTFDFSQLRCIPCGRAGQPCCAEVTCTESGTYCAARTTGNNMCVRQTSTPPPPPPAPPPACNVFAMAHTTGCTNYDGTPGDILSGCDTGCGPDEQAAAASAQLRLSRGTSLCVYWGQTGCCNVIVDQDFNVCGK